MQPTKADIELLTEWLKTHAVPNTALGSMTAEVAWAYYADAYAVESAPGERDGLTLQETLQVWEDMAD